MSKVVCLIESANSSQSLAMTLPTITAQADRLLELEKRFLDAQPIIEHWLRSQWLEHSAPFYASVDLRNSGFKLAPVDTNLFPGGFNNLNPEFLPLCVQAAMTALEKVCPEARGALLIPENHTRNPFYLQNVAVLKNMLRRAGMKVRIGTLIPEITAPTESLCLAAVLLLNAGAQGQPHGLKVRPAVLLNNIYRPVSPDPGGSRAVRHSTSVRWLVDPPVAPLWRVSEGRRGVRRGHRHGPWFVDPYFGAARSTSRSAKARTSGEPR
jgi:hypothetical protein